MKRKDDDLQKIDGVYVPTWARVFAFIVAFAITIVLFYFVLPGITK